MTNKIAGSLNALRAGAVNVGSIENESDPIV